MSRLPGSPSARAARQIRAPRTAERRQAARTARMPRTQQTHQRVQAARMARKGADAAYAADGAEGAAVAAGAARAAVATGAAGAAVAAVAAGAAGADAAEGRVRSTPVSSFTARPRDSIALVFSRRASIWFFTSAGGVNSCVCPSLANGKASKPTRRANPGHPGRTWLLQCVGPHACFGIPLSRRAFRFPFTVFLPVPGLRFENRQPNSRGIPKKISGQNLAIVRDPS